MYVEFDETLITGNKMIDSQHQELIYRINELLKSCENKKINTQEAVKALNFLSDYTNYHFMEEENLQEKIGYPGLEEHRKKHQDLCKVVEDLFEMLSEQGVTEEFISQVNKEVVQWLQYHIQGFDRSVAEYLFLRDNTNRV